jgi:hypothetical protein
MILYKKLFFILLSLVILNSPITLAEDVDDEMLSAGELLKSCEENLPQAHPTNIVCDIYMVLFRQ